MFAMTRAGIGGWPFSILLYILFFFFRSFLTVDIPGMEEAGSMHNSFLNCQLLAKCLTCVT